MVTLTLISTDADVETLCLYNIQPQLLTAHAHAREVYTLHVAWHDPHYDGPWVLFPRCFSSMIKPDYYHCDCRLQSTEPQHEHEHAQAPLEIRDGSLLMMSL